MQLFLPAPPGTMKRVDKPAWRAALQQLALTRTPFGFTIGEALVWVAFVVIWPIILGGIYFFSGMFESGKVMPVKQFIITSFMVAIVKVVVMLPFWWLFFVQWKKLKGWKLAVLHLPASALYSVLCVAMIYQIKTKILLHPYPSNIVLMDCYNLLTAFFMNFILFHAYNFWLSSQRQRKKAQQLRELAFQSEIRALKTQIEPHFLFNTLNSISATVPPTLENTRVLIAQLADTFRYALRVNERQFVSLGHELEFMKTWLALEQHRFGKRLTVYFDIDPKALSTQVPPMLLQPLVENALNHGIAHCVEGGTVTIQCKVRGNNTVFIAVKDTGAGYAGDLAQMMNKGVGLSNIAKRLHLLYNQQIHVERGQQGLSFSFYLPLNQVYETECVDN